jgi:charged multivesicular body protein 5
MNRLFGSRNAKPKPGLAEAIASTEQRADGVEVKIRKLDGELARYRDQMKKMRDGPGKVSRGSQPGRRERPTHV